MAINSNKVDRILEQLNEAMMRASEAVAASKPADLTILAEIVDDTTIANGYYIVWDGSVRYKAYSEKTNYKKGQKVYVLIPEGDTSKQKQITGRYFQETEKIVTINGDWDEYYPLYYLVTSTAEDKEESDYLIIANKEYNFIANNNVNASIASVGKTTNKAELQGRKYLGISFDYFCNLGYDILRNSGYFNLEVLINYAPALKGSTKQKDTYVKTYSVSSRDILGDPFNYLSWHNVKSLIELNPENADDKISSVEVSFKQIGQFATAEGDPYPIAKKPNLGIKNIEISFGNYKTNLGDELTISTLQGTDYDSAQKEEINRKRINLRWVHTGVSDNGKKSSVEIKEGDTFPAHGIKNRTIRWYQNTTKTLEQRNEDIAWQNTEEKTLGKLWHDAQEEGLDDLDPSYWELLINSFRLAENRHYIENGGKKSLTSDGQGLIENAIQSYNDTLELLDSNVLEDAKENGQIPSETPQGDSYEQEIQDNDSKVFTLIFDPPTKRQDCDVWAEVEIEFDNGDIITAKSNVLTFKNKQNIPDEGTMIAARKVEISLLDGSEGNYAIYDEGSGKMISDIYDRQRIMVVECFDESGVNCLNGSEEIMWAIPNNNSMIKFNDSDKAWKEKDELLSESEQREKNALREAMFLQIKAKYGIYLDKYDYIYRAGIKHDNTYYAVDKTQKYRLENYFNHSKTNNVVKCYIKKNNILIEGSVSLNFKQYIVPTTAYKLQLSLGDVYEYKNNQLNWLEPSNNFVKISNQGVNNNIYTELLIQLFDEHGNEIKLTQEEKNAIINKWIGITNNQYSSDGYYSGLSSDKKTKGFYHLWVEGRFFIHMDKRNIDYCKYLALKAKTGILIDENNDGNLTPDEKRFCFSVLPIQSRKRHYLNTSDIPEVNFISSIFPTWIKSGSLPQWQIYITGKEKYIFTKTDGTIEIRERNKQTNGRNGYVSIISIVDIEEKVFDKIRLETGYGIIKYDEKNANPKYLKDKIELKYIQDTDEEIVRKNTDIINEDENDVELWVKEYNWTKNKSHVATQDKLKMVQFYVDDMNAAYEKIAQAEISKGIADTLKENCTVEINLIALNGLKEWMPTLSSETNGRLQVPSAYIEHEVPNDLALEVTLKAKSNNASIMTIYQPMVIVSNKDNIPVIDEEWEGKEVKTGGGKKGSSYSNGQLIVESPPVPMRAMLRATSIDDDTTIAKSSLSYLSQGNSSQKISGLVIGEVQSQYPWNESSGYTTALAGYANGTQVFELNNKGQLFLGKPPIWNGSADSTNYGGLRLDGNTAVIEGGYRLTQLNTTHFKAEPGMTINFNTGSISTSRDLNLNAGGNLNAVAGSKMKFVYGNNNGSNGSFMIADSTDWANADNGLIFDNNKLNIKTKGDVSFQTGSNIEFTYGTGGSFNVHDSSNTNFIKLDSNGVALQTNKGNIDFIFENNNHFYVQKGTGNNTEYIKLDTNGFAIKTKGVVDLTGSTFTLQNTSGTEHLKITGSGGIDIKATTFDLSTSGLSLNNTDGLSMEKGAINLGNGNFMATNDGTLTAKSGTIAGWSIMSNYLASAQSSSGNTNQAGMSPWDKVYLSNEGGPLRVKSNSIAFWAGYTELVNDPNSTGIKLLNCNNPNTSPKFWVKYDGTVYAESLTLGDNSSVSLAAIGNIPVSKIYYNDSTPILTHINNTYATKASVTSLNNNLTNNYYTATTSDGKYYALTQAQKMEQNIGTLAAKVREIISAVNNLIAPNKITNIIIDDGLIVQDPNS